MREYSWKVVHGPTGRIYSRHGSRAAAEAAAAMKRKILNLPNHSDRPEHVQVERIATTQREVTP